LSAKAWRPAEAILGGPMLTTCIGHFSPPERLQRRGDQDEPKQKLQHFSGCRPGERSARHRTNKTFNAHRQTYAQQCGAAGKQSYPAIAEQARGCRIGLFENPEQR
jgi:hypothetical protein